MVTATSFEDRIYNRTAICSVSVQRDCAAIGREADVEIAAMIAEYRELMRELLAQLCENPSTREDGNAPGHAHEVPGVWDSDNDYLAGKPCAWCAVWAKAVANGFVGRP